MRATKIARVVLVVLCRCSSTTEAPTATDTGVDSGTAAVDSGTVDMGLNCSGLSGTYEGTRTRNKAMPGSCSPTYAFEPTFPIKINADSTSPSGYKVEVGYAAPGEPPMFVTCGSTNVVGCTIFASCKPGSGTDEITLTIAGNSVSGNIQRTNTSPMCTVNFDVVGVRK